MIQPHELSELLKVLEDARVVDATLEGIGSFKFSPRPPSAPTKRPATPEQCRCGHHEYQHGQMGCLMGCPLELCVASETPSKG